MVYCNEILKTIMMGKGLRLKIFSFTDMFCFNETQYAKI